MEQESETLIIDLINEQLDVLKENLNQIIGACRNLLEFALVIKMKKNNVLSKKNMNQINEISIKLTYLYKELLKYKEKIK